MSDRLVSILLKIGVGLFFSLSYLLWGVLDRQWSVFLDSPILHSVVTCMTATLLLSAPVGIVCLMICIKLDVLQTLFGGAWLLASLSNLFVFLFVPAAWYTESAVFTHGDGGGSFLVLPMNTLVGVSLVIFGVTSLLTAIMIDE